MAEDIWKEKNLAEAYMYDIYFAFQDAGFTEELQASACDEALFTHGREFRESNAGAVTDVNLGWFAKTQSGHQWQRLYLNIRSCNDFIENLENSLGLKVFYFHIFWGLNIGCNNLKNALSVNKVKGKSF